MKWISFIAVCLIILSGIWFFFSPKPAPEISAPKVNTFYLGGIQVNEYSLDRWVKTLDSIGMNTVSVTVYAQQANWDGYHLWYNDEEKWVVEEIRKAKQEGLKVIMILRVALQSMYPKNKFLWHGMIHPKTDFDLYSWFWRYKDFAIKWADIAQKEGVDIFAIGSELNAMTATQAIKEMPPLYGYFNSDTTQEKHEKRALKYDRILKDEHLWIRGDSNYQHLEHLINDRIKAQRDWAHQITFQDDGNFLELMNERRKKIEAYWIDIIREIRTRYSGQLTYAANFDSYQDVGFWEHLDFMGINAYFQLRKPQSEYPSSIDMKAEMQKSWETIFEEIASFKELETIQEQPILFTELGYLRAKDTTLEPWQGFGFSIIGPPKNERLIIWKEQEESPFERATAVEALYEEVVQKKINLRGILYWKLTTHYYHLPVEPFALHISPQPVDSLQNALTKFGDFF